MELRTHFYEFSSNLESFSSYEQRYSYVKGYADEDKKHIYQKFDYYQIIFIKEENCFSSGNRPLGGKSIVNTILEAHKFLSNLVDNLDESDDLLNYFSLVDSPIFKDVSLNDSFQFSEPLNDYKQVKIDLKNYLFSKFCFFKTTEIISQSNFINYFNENYCKKNDHIKNKKTSFETNHCAYGFVQYGHMEDVVFINFNSIFNSFNQEFPCGDNPNNHNIGNKKVSDEVVKQIHKLNMIFFHLHEMSHNKIFKYALHQKKYKSRFNTPAIKCITGESISESGFLIEKLIAVIFFKYIWL